MTNIAFRPETVLVLRALSTFEALYLSRSTTRLNEAVSQAFSGGSRSPPGANDAVTIARAVINELDSARFDPLLILAVARNIGTALDSATTRAESLVSSLTSQYAFHDIVISRFTRTAQQSPCLGRWRLHNRL